MKSLTQWIWRMKIAPTILSQHNKFQWRAFFLFFLFSVFATSKYEGYRLTSPSTECIRTKTIATTQISIMFLRFMNWFSGTGGTTTRLARLYFIVNAVAGVVVVVMVVLGREDGSPFSLWHVVVVISLICDDSNNYFHIFPITWRIRTIFSFLVKSSVNPCEGSARGGQHVLHLNFKYMLAVAFEF